MLRCHRNFYSRDSYTYIRTFVSYVYPLLFPISLAGRSLLYNHINALPPPHPHSNPILIILLIALDLRIVRLPVPIRAQIPRKCACLPQYLPGDDRFTACSVLEGIAIYRSNPLFTDLLVGHRSRIYGVALQSFHTR